jgi:RecA/RadA recombinase
MAENKWMRMMNKMEGAVDRQYDPYLPENTIQTISPSLNWIFSKSSGLPLMEFCVLYGEPKSGKSIIANAFVAGLHSKFSDAVAIKFDTELREVGEVESFWGIDPERYMVFNVNEPELIFDRLRKEIFPMVEAGMPLKMVIIDSLNSIQGIKFMNADSITNHQIGDSAMTIQKGLASIMPFLRRHKISLLTTSQVRGNLDGAGMHAPKTKAALTWAAKHTMEYFIKVSRDNSAEGKVDAMGDKLENAELKDFKGKTEKTGHKIYFELTESTRGVAGRSGQITFDYDRGIINTHEEIFELSKNLNLVERPNNRTYIYGGETYSSKEEFLMAIKDREDVRNGLLELIYKK